MDGFCMDPLFFSEIPATSPVDEKREEKKCEKKSLQN